MLQEHGECSLDSGSPVAPNPGPLAATLAATVTPVKDKRVAAVAMPAAAGAPQPQGHVACEVRADGLASVSWTHVCAFQRELSSQENAETSVQLLEFLRFTFWRIGT